MRSEFGGASGAPFGRTIGRRSSGIGSDRSRRREVVGVFEHDDVAVELEAVEMVSQESGVCGREVGVMGLNEVGYSLSVGSVWVVQPQNGRGYHLQQNQNQNQHSSSSSSE